MTFEGNKNTRKQASKWSILSQHSPDMAWGNKLLNKTDIRSPSRPNRPGKQMSVRPVRVPTPAGGQGGQTDQWPKSLTTTPKLRASPSILSFPLVTSMKLSVLLTITSNPNLLMFHDT